MQEKYWAFAEKREKERGYWIKMSKQFLERYYVLIVYNAYLNDIMIKQNKSCVSTENKSFIALGPRSLTTYSVDHCFKANNAHKNFRNKNYSNKNDDVPPETSSHVLHFPSLSQHAKLGLIFSFIR